ncbi:MAG TPA: AAA family ATPase [Dehalococcoidia bacterium]|nr:AAA family ATPase [Dehalococcoidia bacterium]
MAKTPAALIIDEDIQARFEMRQVVRATGLQMAGESGYGQAALTAASEYRPEIIIIGINEPMERALQTMESLQALLPETPIVVYSDSREIDTARKAMIAGARDFLPRPVRPDVLRDSILKSMAAEENRRLRNNGSTPAAQILGTIVTVFGAKGGIGKSTISTNLAVALAKQNSSVVIVDLDNGFGDVCGMLDVKPERTLADMAHDIDSLERADITRYVVKHEHSGLDVLAGPPLLEWRKLPTDDVRRVIDLLATHYDKIVLDTSGTLNDVSEMALEVATIVLWVTTTEFASVRDSLEAMRVLQALSVPHERMRIVMNAISPDDNVRPSAVQDVLQRDVFWQIPYDRRVRQGTHLGQPIVITTPQSVAAKSFFDLATAISGGRGEPGKRAFKGFKWRSGSAPAVAETSS